MPWVELVAHPAEVLGTPSAAHRRLSFVNGRPIATFTIAARNAALDAANARKLAEFAREADVPVNKGATAAGDTRKLRGIPAIGRGVGGASEGSNPLAALIAKETRALRDAA